MVEVKESVRGRIGEMRYFRTAMQSPETLDESAQPEYFRAMVALATSDYQVNPSELAAALQVSEEEVRRWGDNSRDDLEVPSEDVRKRVIEFLDTDIGKKLELLN